jgi:hypothetical protein
MSFLNSPSDDMPEPCNRANLFSLSALRRQRDDAIRQMDDTIRMVERQRDGDASFTGAGCRMTVAATKNALEAFLRSMGAVEAEVLPAKPLPVAKPFGRRIPDAALPATVSPASAA